MSHPSILQLVSSSGFYGAERVLLELALHLEREGWRSHVGALQHDRSAVAVVERARRHGLQTVLFPCGSGFDAAAMRSIRSYTKQHDIDIAHSHGYKSNIFLFCSIGRRGPAARLPGHHAPAYPCRSPEARWWPWRVRPEGPKLVSTCHNWLTDSLKLMVYELLDKLTLHQFDHVVAVSPPLDRELAAAGIPPDRHSVIDNGLDLGQSLSPEQREDLRRSLGVAPAEPMLLAIGRLDPWKAYDRLLEAMARLGPDRRARLVLVGDGELRDALESQARELGVDRRVTFAGYRTDVGQLLLAADLFVISSRKEGLPMVLLEAMAAGLPVVATRVGAIESTLEQGAAGALVPSEDSGRLAAAIGELLDAPERRLELGRRGHAAHQARFSRRAMGQRYIALYRQLLGGR